MILGLPEDEYSDGYFAGWMPSSQVRTSRGRLVADLEASWADPVEATRSIRLFSEDTTDWPVGEHEVDIQLTRASDGFVRSTETFTVDIVKDITVTSNA